MEEKFIIIKSALKDETECNFRNRGEKKDFSHSTINFKF